MDKHLWTQRSRWSTQSLEFHRARSWEARVGGLQYVLNKWGRSGRGPWFILTPWNADRGRLAFLEFTTKTQRTHEDPTRWQWRWQKDAYTTLSQHLHCSKGSYEGWTMEESCHAALPGTFWQLYTQILSSGLKLIHWPPKTKVYPELPDLRVWSRNGGIPKFMQMLIDVDRESMEKWWSTVGFSALYPILKLSSSVLKAELGTASVGEHLSRQGVIPHHPHPLESVDYLLKNIYPDIHGYKLGFKSSASSMNARDFLA